MPENTVHYQDYETLVEMLRKSDQTFNMELIDKAYRLAEKRTAASCACPACRISCIQPRSPVFWLTWEWIRNR